MLTVRSLHSYYDTAHVLQGPDLEVEPGEVVGLLGRNGMGKTTLVRSVCGIRPPDVRGGRVIYEDRDVTALPSHAIARLGIGLVPQGRRIFGSLTTAENLTVAARPGRDGDDRWGLAEVFELFPRLAERKRSRGTDLSGGEQQMLAIGRALMTNPRLLVMDEPSEGLAPVVIGMLRDRLTELKATGLSILLVEQNVGLALSVSDRIYLLGEGGTIAWSGTPAGLDGRKELKTLHLGV